MTREKAEEAYAYAKANYERGGDTIVECFTLDEIAERFDTLDEVREFCGLKVEAALNARWGEDDDPELDTARRFGEGWLKP